jgi:hypothetical protein
MSERKPVFSPQRILDERDELKDALFDMVGQFAYEGKKNNKVVLHTGGLSSLENAFKALRLSNPIAKKDFEDRLNINNIDRQIKALEEQKKPYLEKIKMFN